MADIAQILSKLDKKTRDRVQAAIEIEVTKAETPSVSLNKALAGGIGYGRQTLIWGTKSAGKTALCLGIIAKAQEDGKTCAFVDAEGSFDPNWASRLGVNVDELIVSQVKTTADMVEVVTDLMSAGIDVVVVDSISGLLPSSFFEKKTGELSNLDDTKQIGGEARDLANAVKMLNYVNKKTALILISQLRNKITTYGAMHQHQGGHAVMFFSTTSIKLWASAREADQIEGEVSLGNKIYKTPIGRTVTWTVEFNKIGPPSQSGNYDFYYGGDSVGIDTVGEAVDEAERLGIIVKSGAWYKVFDETFQGKAKTVQWFKDNPEALDKLIAMMNEPSNV
jgi:recombination protein RecA